MGINGALDLVWYLTPLNPNRVGLVCDLFHCFSSLKNARHRCFSFEEVTRSFLVDWVAALALCGIADPAGKQLSAGVELASCRLTIKEL